MKDDPEHKAKEKARARRRYLEKKQDPEWYAGLCERRDKWRENNPERALAIMKNTNARRREQKLGSISELTNEQVGEIRGIYLQCDRLNGIFGEQVFEVDHTVPLSKGGKHHPNNLQIVPRSWNREKRNNHSERWEVPFANIKISIR